MTREQGEALLLYIDAATSDTASQIVLASLGEPLVLSVEVVKRRAEERTAAKLAFLALLP